MNRRSFVAGLAALSGTALLGRRAAAAEGPNGGGDRPARSRVAIAHATDRAQGVRDALALLELPSWKGQRLFVKPNFNSADPFPGSTHPQTLRALLETLTRGGASGLAVGDRSGIGDTRAVMEKKGIPALARELHAELVVFDELPASGWIRQSVPGMHWSRGFALARPALEADAIVQACNLKTHRFGGHFTLSLKNSVGLVARRIPGDDHDYMRELHQSEHQRRMIAEVNAAYRPLVVVMDALEAFVDGGPDVGRKVAPGLFLASQDRVALDAVGVAILRRHGTTPEVSRGPIFGLEQIARAAELGVGARSADEIEIVARAAPAQEEAKRLADALRA